MDSNSSSNNNNSILLSSPSPSGMISRWIYQYCSSVGLTDSMKEYESVLIQLLTPNEWARCREEGVIRLEIRKLIQLLGDGPELADRLESGLDSLDSLTRLTKMDMSVNSTYFTLHVLFRIQAIMKLINLPQLFEEHLEYWLGLEENINNNNNLKSEGNDTIDNFKKKKAYLSARDKLLQYKLDFQQNNIEKINQFKATYSRESVDLTLNAHIESIKKRLRLPEPALNMFERDIRTRHYIPTIINTENTVSNTNPSNINIQPITTDINQTGPPPQANIAPNTSNNTAQVNAARKRTTASVASSPEKVPPTSKRTRSKAPSKPEPVVIEEEAEIDQEMKEEPKQQQVTDTEELKSESPLKGRVRKAARPNQPTQSTTSVPSAQEISVNPSVNTNTTTTSSSSSNIAAVLAANASVSNTLRSATDQLINRGVDPLAESVAMADKVLSKQQQAKQRRPLDEEHSDAEAVEPVEFDDQDLHSHQVTKTRSSQRNKNNNSNEGEIDTELTDDEAENADPIEISDEEGSTKEGIGHSIKLSSYEPKAIGNLKKGVKTVKKPAASNAAVSTGRVAFSEEEEYVLAQGMAEFGTEHKKWQMILDKYRDVFDSSRTAVHLKDKWRNIQLKKSREAQGRSKQRSGGAGGNKKLLLNNTNANEDDTIAEGSDAQDMEI